MLDIVLLVGGVGLIVGGLVIFMFTYRLRHLPKSETSSSDIKHFVHSGAHRIHGMVRTRKGHVSPDSKPSSSFIESLL